MPGDRTQRSLDASHAIPTRVLRFEVSELRRRTPVRPVLTTGQTGTHRSDRSDPPVRPVWRCCSSVFGSSVLALWINQGTQWFSGEPTDTPRTRCSLRQSPLMTRLPRSPGSTLVLRLNQETVHDFALLFMPPCGPHLTPLATGSLEQAYLSSHLEASLAMTFRACSSPAPTPVKRQPAPAILSQESVHTTLSITHHTRKRPSTGPRTTHGPHTLTDSRCLTFKTSCMSPLMIYLRSNNCS
jgi:hypothetical protein